tara:strand:+ start:1786 stop:2088 length:303 start_codon:yes stop_codon:yes gene_type:complete
MTSKKDLKKIEIGSLLVITWLDASDSYSEGVKVKELQEWADKNGNTVYSTPGYFMGVVNEKCYLGFNRDENTMEELYRGVAEIPLTMIERIHAIQRPRRK